MLRAMPGESVENRSICGKFLKKLAGTTRLELATSAVTGRYFYDNPSYARHGLAASADNLSSVRIRGNLAFLEPLVITRDRMIIDGYVRRLGKICFQTPYLLF